MKEYFIEYRPIENKEPYSLPKKIKEQLTLLGVITKDEEYPFQPVVIAQIPDSKIDEVKKLEGIVNVYNDSQLDLFA